MMMDKRKQAFLRSYGPIMAVADIVDCLPDGVPITRIWTEVYGGADAHAMVPGICRVDALRYVVTLRPWPHQWSGAFSAVPKLGHDMHMLGPEIPVWSYPGIAADGPAILSAEGPLRINGHGDIPT
jgi:hypothetical protein